MPKRPISACPAVGEADFTSLSARANESDKLTYHLRSQPESVAEARALTRAALLRWGHPELIEDATLIVSELVTNAIRYAHAPGRGRTGDPLTLVLLRVASHVLLAVGDPSPRIPARAELRGHRLGHQGLLGHDGDAPGPACAAASPAGHHDRPSSGRLPGRAHPVTGALAGCGRRGPAVRRLAGTGRP